MVRSNIPLAYVFLFTIRPFDYFRHESGASHGGPTVEFFHASGSCNQSAPGLQNQHSLGGELVLAVELFPSCFRLAGAKMVCEFCSRLLSFQLQALPYSPPQRQALRESSGPSTVNSQPTSARIVGRLRGLGLKTSTQPTVALATRKEHIPIYEDTDKVFYLTLLWWQVSISGGCLKSGKTHKPGYRCQLYDIIFRNLSPSIVYALLQDTTRDQDGASFVYRLSNNRGETRLSIWLYKQQQLLPLIRLDITLIFTYTGKVSVTESEFSRQEIIECRRANNFDGMS